MKTEFVVPFWEKSKDNKSSFYKFEQKKFIFYLKCIFYVFSGFMIFWSFIQSFAAPYTNYNVNPGEGLEFGYLPGKNGTGNVKFDLGSWSLLGPGYHAFFAPATVYGPFLSWFVYPVARIFVNLIWFFHSRSNFLSTSGLDVVLAMIILMFIMRFISFWSVLRSSIYSERQLHHQSAIDAISARYERYDPTDREAKLRKHKEIMAYNKKYDLKPFATLENFFISTPIFLIIFKVVTISRPIKFTILFGIWDLSKTPSSVVFNDFLNSGWKYLLLCLFIIPVNFVSQKTSAWFSNLRHPHLKNKAINKNSQAYKMRQTQQIMTIVFLLFAFFWSTSLAIYYFFNSLLTILQNWIIHRILINRKEKSSGALVKLRKLGLNV